MKTDVQISSDMLNTYLIGLCKQYYWDIIKVLRYDKPHKNSLRNSLWKRSTIWIFKTSAMTCQYTQNDLEILFTCCFCCADFETLIKNMLGFIQTLEKISVFKCFFDDIINLSVLKQVSWWSFRKLVQLPTQEIT